MRILIITLSILSLSVNACPKYKKQVTGDKAPCDGYFFNLETEKRIRKDVRDNELRKEQIKLKDLQIKKITQDRDDWKSEAKKQSEASHSKDSDLTKGFLGGIALSVLLMFGVKKALD